MDSFSQAKSRNTLRPKGVQRRRLFHHKLLSLSMANGVHRSSECWFKWFVHASIDPILHFLSESSGLAYRGTSLEGCDITTIYVDGDIRTWTLEIVGVMTCKPADGSYEVAAKTAYTISALPGKHNPMLGVSQTGGLTAQLNGAKNPRPVRGDPRGSSLLTRYVELSC